MKQLLSLALALLPCLAWAQYPNNGNQKITLGEQTTADGLLFRGVAATDTVRKPSIDTMAYMVLDTTTNIIWHYKKATSNAWLRLNLLPSDTASMLTNYYRSGRTGIIQASDVPTLNQNTTGSAATLTTSRTFQTNLASTSTASFNGSANVTPGVTGTLPVANGGTNASTFTSGSVVFAGSGGTYTQDNSNFFWDNTNKRLGINKTPEYGIDVLRVRTNANKNTTIESAGFFESDITNTDNSTYQVFGIGSTLRYKGTQGTTNSRGIIGYLSSVFNTNTGTTTNYTGYYLDLRNLSTGTLTNATGVKIIDFDNSGTITNKYGLVTEISTSGATNSYNIYASGNAPNYFNGDVGIGTSSPAVQFHTTSNVRFAGLTSITDLQTDADGDLFNGSDFNLKNSIDTINFGLQDVLKLKPVQFNWNDISRNLNEYKNLGFIAQDVMDVIPNAASSMGDGDMQVDYNAIVATLTKAIQEQQSQIEQLKQRIINLENK